MPFTKEYLNLGGGMNFGSGVFKAPKAGVYAFSFRGDAAGSSSSYAGNAVVYLQRNGSKVTYGDSRLNGATGGYVTISLHATLKLNAGDQITIVLTSGAISSGYDGGTQFMGSLLEEDLVIS